jgi:hypothetical protein
MEPTAGDPGQPGNVERGKTNLGAADPFGNSRPGPVLAYVRPTSADSQKRVWPRRLMLIIFVVFCMEVGIMMVVLPWKQVWTNNLLIVQYPAARAFLSNFFVRGLFSGLGLLDLWIGIWEAVHYSEH